MALLDVAVERCTGAGAARGCLAAKAALELAPHDKDIAAWLKRFHRRNVESLAKAIVRGQEQGEVNRRLDPRAAARFLMNGIAGLRLLIFTGARKSEILGLHWRMVEFERALLRLPDSKTGEKVIYLSAPALQLLAELPRIAGNPHVLPGERSGRHLVNIEKTWRRVRHDAGLDDVRLHDLRHSFAAIGAGAGLGLPVIGALLGHTETSTTARYAHLAADPVRAANEAIGRRIAAALAGNDGGTIVPLVGTR